MYEIIKYSLFSIFFYKGSFAAAGGSMGENETGSRVLKSTNFNFASCGVVIHPENSRQAMCTAVGLRSVRR